jgi:DNA-binding transcriptional ArsR family regulator
MVQQVVPGRVFHALGDPTRLALVDRLGAAGETSAGELARPFPMTLTAVQKHLRVLERAGVVRTRKHGRERLCRLERPALDAATAWLESRRKLWSGRLDALETHLAEEKHDA